MVHGNMVLHSDNQLTIYLRFVVADIQNFRFAAGELEQTSE